MDFNTGGGMSSAMDWHTGLGAWITVPASCISAPTIIGQMIVHPMVVFIHNPRVLPATFLQGCQQPFFGEMFFAQFVEE